MTGSLSPATSAAEHQPNAETVPFKAQRGGLRFDRRLWLVYGLLLLDVVVIGSTSLQHFWQPANLIDKVLQNHNALTDVAPLLRLSPSQHQLPIAVKRELGMSCCCGWLALAVMGTLSLMLSYSPTPVPSAADGCSTFIAAGNVPKDVATTSIRRRRTSPVHAGEVSYCNACTRTLDEVELQVKLKYLLVAVATFCVFFALNLVVQIHGRFQQSKVTVAALKTLAAENTESDGSARGSSLHMLGSGNHQRFASDNTNFSSYEATGPVQSKYKERGADAYEGDGSSDTPQSPPYFYWRDFFFWVELGRECFFDGEIQLSSLWVLLHAATLLGGRRVLRSRKQVVPSCG